MTIKRFFKKCEEFTICSEIGDAGDYFFDGYPDNLTIYHFVVKGNGKLGAVYEAEYIQLNYHKLVDVKEYLYKQRVYHAAEDFHIIGFNPLKPGHNWDGRLVTESFTGDDMSWLICFDGNPVVNGKKLSRWDYAKLETKEYDIQLNGGCLGLFTRL